MMLDAVVGAILVLFGVALIAYRKRVYLAIHSLLEKFFGGAVADMSVYPRTAPRWSIFVGVVAIGLGAFNLIDIIV